MPHWKSCRNKREHIGKASVKRSDEEMEEGILINGLISDGMRVVRKD